ncbi:MAG: hypothetical protein JSR44_02740 [Spirochaetes bacterium]|nr:hypothetical protein [Spirochaetota bacterium]
MLYPRSKFSFVLLLFFIVASVVYSADETQPAAQPSALPKAPAIPVPAASSIPRAIEAQSVKPASEITSIDEISDSTGRIVKGKVLQVTEKEVLYRDVATSEEKKIAIENIIFIRSANGEYRFFFPSEAPIEPQKKPTDSGTASDTYELHLTLGFAAHFADNSANASNLSGYAAQQANQLNQQAGSNLYTSSLGRDAASVVWQFYAEPRLVFREFILGLNVGYAAMPKTAAVVSTPLTAAAMTINFTGYFVPLSAIFYYRLVNDGAWGVNLGFGAGVLFTSADIATKQGIATNEQILTSANPLLIFKPELTYKIGSFILLASLPIYWASARDMSDGSNTLLTADGKNVVSPNISGIGISLAAGIKW